MSFLGRFFSFFPFLHVMATACFALVAIDEIHDFGLFSFFAALSLLSLYLMPPLLFRVHNRVYPLKRGAWSLSTAEYVPWWGAHQIQLVFIAFPSLEAFLRIIPGVYSAWLRLWGAKVGKRVYWTPSVQIIDRPMTEIGDDVTFGHESALCAHVVTRRKDSVRLLVSGISIGKGCLIGARTRLGPGVVVHPFVDLPYNTEGWINQEFKE